MFDAHRLNWGTTGHILFGKVVVMDVVAWDIKAYPPEREGEPPSFVLKAQGYVRRFWRGQPSMHLIAHLTPAAVPYRIGRPRPTPPQSFTFAGDIHTCTSVLLVMNHGTYL